jgi:hypothetical protein
MRCILVNDAYLKADAYCAHCRSKIGEQYVRQIGSGVLFCDFDCYQCATDPLVDLQSGFASSANSRTRQS